MGCGDSKIKHIGTQVTPQPISPTRTVRSAEFSSDTVTKVIDTGHDEHPVKETEEDYPKPTPPDNDFEEIRPMNNWFEDEDFEKGSDEYVEVHNAETINDDYDDDILGLILRPRVEQLRHGNRPRISFKEIDEHAKTASATVAGSFGTLLQYLTRTIPIDDVNKDMLTARAIIVWLAQQDIDGGNFGHDTLDTPNGLLQSLKEHKMTYATCYTRLCRRARLKCTLIKGLVKAASHQPGDADAPSALWTAVYVDGGWQLVHPFWICRAVYGHSLGGWVKIEADGTTLAEREEASRGVVRKTFREYYFMPRPQRFIYECYAEDTPWQLLQSTSVIRSKKEFLEMPYLLPPFFGVGLELVSYHACSLTATNGKCEIVMKANPRNAHMLVLRYELFEKATDSFKKHRHVARMVFNSRSNEWFEFDIRFPNPGEFKFIVYGGPYESPALRLCEFQIICRTPFRAYIPLPLACDEIGWGPGPASTGAGLLVPRKVSGFIQMRQNKPMEIKFHLPPQRIRFNKYTASLHRVSGEQIDDGQYVSCRTINKWLIFTITLPTEDTFGMSISVRDRGSGNWSTVCNYLLSTGSSRRLRANVKIAIQKLVEACDSNLHLPKKVDDIKQQIEHCRHRGVEENDADFCAALVLFEYLYHKNELRWADMRDHLGFALKTLQRISKYKYRDALHLEINKVEQVADSHEPRN